MSIEIFNYDNNNVIVYEIGDYFNRASLAKYKKDNIYKNISIDDLASIPLNSANKNNYYMKDIISSVSNNEKFKLNINTKQNYKVHHKNSNNDQPDKEKADNKGESIYDYSKENNKIEESEEDDDNDDINNQQLRHMEKLKSISNTRSHNIIKLTIYSESDMENPRYIIFNEDYFNYHFHIGEGYYVKNTKIICGIDNLNQLQFIGDNNIYKRNNKNRYKQSKDQCQSYHNMSHRQYQMLKQQQQRQRKTILKKYLEIDCENGFYSMKISRLAIYTLLKLSFIRHTNHSQYQFNNNNEYIIRSSNKLPKELYRRIYEYIKEPAKFILYNLSEFNVLELKISNIKPIILCKGYQIRLGKDYMLEILDMQTIDQEYIYEIINHEKNTTKFLNIYGLNNDDLRQNDNNSHHFDGYYLQSSSSYNNIPHENAYPYNHNDNTWIYTQGQEYEFLRFQESYNELHSPISVNYIKIMIEELFYHNRSYAIIFNLKNKPFIIGNNNNPIADMNLHSKYISPYQLCINYQQIENNKYEWCALDGLKTNESKYGSWLRIKKLHQQGWILNNDDIIQINPNYAFKFSTEKL